ncbi:uncharacterized protein LOC110688610 [Chenopodium quinoa]|uniref:uncharacterized protein LOC110688610 n=1 Tax=Chenopodium quinoa TaxID=63459 RepID=UPI000B77F359|nr:uncharacterized protein LOC110688610 [Chenopodium quinoa]
MVWNVQGAGNKLATITELIRINDPEVLALVETHLSGEQAHKVCDRIGFWGQTRVDAQGFSGGIWLFWREELVSVTILDNHTQHITVEIEKRGEDPWIFSAIYANPDSTLRKELWNELWNHTGDFNDAVNLEERHGVGGSEIGLSPNSFKSARLDRGLVNEDWRLRFVEGAVRSLPRLTSDHCPILISTNGFAPIPNL